MEASYNCDDILSGGYWVDFDTNTNTTLVQRRRLHPRIVHPGELLLQTLDLLTELVVVGRGDGQPLRLSTRRTWPKGCWLGEMLQSVAELGIFRLIITNWVFLD